MKVPSIKSQTETRKRKETIAGEVQFIERLHLACGGTVNFRRIVNKTQ